MNACSAHALRPTKPMLLCAQNAVPAEAPSWRTGQSCLQVHPAVWLQRRLPELHGLQVQGGSAGHLQWVLPACAVQPCRGRCCSCHLRAMLQLCCWTACTVLGLSKQTHVAQKPSIYTQIASSTFTNSIPWRISCCPRRRPLPAAALGPTQWGGAQGEDSPAGGPQYRHQ